MSLILIQGPAGAGKSPLAASMLRAGEAAVPDVTALWAAFGLHTRGPDRRYPVRADDDPALALAPSEQVSAVRRGLRLGRRMIVTTSRRGQVSRWA